MSDEIDEACEGVGPKIDQPKAMWTGISQCDRQSALTALESRINARRQELADLDALYRSLPRELSPEADRALWNLLMNQRIG